MCCLVALGGREKYGKLTTSMQLAFYLIFYDSLACMLEKLMMFAKNYDYLFHTGWDEFHKYKLSDYFSWEDNF